AMTGKFHLFYLNAPSESYATGAHHQAATVGYGVTKDFLEIEWGAHDVLRADPQGWDNTSIWTGDVLRIGKGFWMFYTSRDHHRDDGFTQAIGVARADQIDARHWQRISRLPLEVNSPDYEPRGIQGDLSVHAWRDPFLFRWGGDTYMLLSAKAAGRPLGRNGAVAWLKACDPQLNQWQPLPPLVVPGHYSEMEVPQVYRRPDGRLALLFSTTAALDFTPESPHQGGIYAMAAEGFEGFAHQVPRNILPASSGLYACRAIPELAGELIGFDLATGGIRRSGIQTHLQSLDKDFSDIFLEVPE
ncbi:beta-fructosidase, partial [filamentous cyanobacterium CCP5]